MILHSKETLQSFEKPNSEIAREFMKSELHHTDRSPLMERIVRFIHNGEGLSSIFIDYEQSRLDLLDVELECLRLSFENVRAAYKKKEEAAQGVLSAKQMFDLRAGYGEMLALLNDIQAAVHDEKNLTRLTQNLYNRIDKILEAHHV